LEKLKQTEAEGDELMHKMNCIELIILGKMGAIYVEDGRA
jgi:hypothetical protein